MWLGRTAIRRPRDAETQAYPAHIKTLCCNPQCCLITFHALPVMLGLTLFSFILMILIAIQPLPPRVTKSRIDRAGLRSF